MLPQAGTLFMTTQTMIELHSKKIHFPAAIRIDSFAGQPESPAAGP
jgi:hypothetical protein